MFIPSNVFSNRRRILYAICVGTRTGPMFYGILAFVIDLFIGSSFAKDLNVTIKSDGQSVDIVSRLPADSVALDRNGRRCSIVVHDHTYIIDLRSGELLGDVQLSDHSFVASHFLDDNRLLLVGQSARDKSIKVSQYDIVRKKFEYSATLDSTADFRATHAVVSPDSSFASVLASTKGRLDLNKDGVAIVFPLPAKDFSSVNLLKPCHISAGGNSTIDVSQSGAMIAFTGPFEDLSIVEMSDTRQKVKAHYTRSVSESIVSHSFIGLESIVARGRSGELFVCRGPKWEYREIDKALFAESAVVHVATAPRTPYGVVYTENGHYYLIDEQVSRIIKQDIIVDSPKPMSIVLSAAGKERLCCVIMISSKQFCIRYIDTSGIERKHK